jgi:hypothetical protein
MKKYCFIDAKILKIVKIFCILFLSKAGFSQADTIKSAPKIQFSELTFDFGEISDDTIVKHIFVFENTDNQEVMIKDVVTQCGCTSSNFDKKITNPNDTGELEISFNSYGKYAYQRKNIRVIFSNGEEVKLTILAQIVH